MSTSKKICAQCGEEYGAEQRFCPKDGSPLRPVGGDDPLIGQVLADRYQILDVIGEGGMGRVYLAEHVRMGRRSALKVINPSLSVSAEAISRFNREASNASRINHPNVAQIYDFGETPDGTLYLAMEFIEGETLTTIIEREGAIPLGQAGQIAKQIADGLAAAHHLGIVHRDLKPDNIMVGRHVDGSDWVKVVDFGIAKTMQGNSGDAPSQTVTTAGVSLGTPEYMSPEQLAGERLDARTDIYSLGLVVFNMLTADLPYPRVTSKETLIRRLTSPPRTLAEVRPEVAWPAALQIALSRALAPEVDDRFPSVSEFGQAIVMATAGAIDPGKTVRISSVSGMAAVRASSAMPGPGQTRQLSEPAAGRGRGVLIGSIVGILAMAGAAFALVHERQGEMGKNESTPPVAVAQDSVHQPADSLPAKAPLPGGAAAKASPHAPPGSVGAASADAQSTPTSTTGATAQKAAESGSGKAASDTAPSTKVSASGTVAATVSDSGSRAAGGGVSRAGRQGRRGAGVGGNGRGLGRGTANVVQQEHAWAAPQDTAAGFSKGVQDSIRVKAASDEINQHLADIVRLVQNGRIQMVRSEVSDVQEDIRLVTSMFSDIPGTQSIRTMVKARKVELLNGCLSAFAAKPALFPPTFSVNNCNGLFSSLNGGPGGR